MAHRAHRTSHRTTVRYEYLLIGPPASLYRIKAEQSVFGYSCGRILDAHHVPTNQKREMRSPSHLRISLCCVCGARSEVRAGWLGSASNDLGKAPTTRGPRKDASLAD